MGEPAQHSAEAEGFPSGLREDFRQDTPRKQQQHEEPMMKRRMWARRSAVVILQAIVWVLCPLMPVASQAANALRPPSVPLVACDPYFSIWSPADKLTDADTVHWTGKRQPLRSVLRIDDQNYRVMGAGSAEEQVLAQKSLTVLPTRTIYTFEGAGMALTLIFMTPALPEDLMVYSRPVTYVSYEFHSIDGKTPDVVVGLGVFAVIAVNNPQQEVVLSIPA